MKREEKLLKNTVILAIGRFLPKVGAFIVVPILTGYLTKEEYGTYDLVSVLSSFILPVATLQIQTAAFRYLIDVRNNTSESKRIITNLFAFIVVTSIVALSIVFSFLPGDINTRLVVIGYYLADILVNAARQCARGLEKNRDYTISAIVSSLCKIILAILLVWYFRTGLQGAFFSLLIASTISLFVLSYRIHLLQYIEIKLISWQSIKRLLQYSWAMVPNTLSMEIMRLSDRFVVTSVMGIVSNAVYAAANKIPNILTVAQITFTMAWQENASIVSKDEDAREYYSTMFRTMYDLMGGSLGLLICATPLLFRLLIRGDYSEAYYQMPILFIASFLYSMCAFLGGIYVAYKDTKSVGITTMAAAACNLIVDIALIRIIGLYAASGSTLISYLFLFLFRMYDVQKLVKLEYEYGHMALVAILLVAESILCYINNTVSNIVNLFFGVLLFVLLNKKFLKSFWNKGVQVLKKRKL